MAGREEGTRVKEGVHRVVCLAAKPFSSCGKTWRQQPRGDAAVRVPGRPGQIGWTAGPGAFSTCFQVARQRVTGSLQQH